MATGSNTGVGNMETKVEEAGAGDATIWFMETEMRFSCSQFAKAFQEEISSEAQMRIWAYCKGRSTVDAIRLLGLKCTEQTFSNKLREAAIKIGAPNVRAMLKKQPESTMKVDATFLKSLIEKQEFRCALSGIELTPETAALDHIIPYSRGGRHRRDNVQWVHDDINTLKGQVEYGRFVELCRLVAAWNG